MKIARLHRRLSVLLALSALAAFASSAGVEPLPALGAAVVLLAALAWAPSEEVGTVIERVAMVAAVILAARALHVVLGGRGDVVVPVVDLLLLLMAAESLRPLSAGSEMRLHALAFALLLAATAYRPGLPFALAFVAFVGLGVAAFTVGHLRRRSREEGLRRTPMGRTLAWTTGGLAVAVLGASVLVFLFFPRVSRGWANRGRPAATSVAGFADEVSLAAHGARIEGNPEIVLRVEFPGGRPPDVGSLRWRGRSYDRFDGVRWSHSRSLPLSAPRSRWYARRWPGPRRRTKIYSAPLDVHVLFALHPVVEVEAKPGIHPLLDNAGDLRYMGSGMPVYTAVSMEGRPSEEALRASGGNLAPPARHFLQLPPLPDRVPALADSLAAGAGSRYERAVRIRDWLREEFAYTRELPATAEEATLEHFLFRRRAGHCEYFSTGMAVLLRTLGIPARNVNGFLGGDWNEFGGYLAVTQNDAHSWVEVWFPDQGWVPFDPTPAGSGSGDAARSGFWPGRFLFDGLQHRWSKWVLDYDPELQTGLLGRAREMVGDRAPGTGEGESGEGLALPGGWRLAAVIVGGVVALVIARLLLRRRKRGGTPEARIYLDARRAYRRRGFEVPESAPPLALVDVLDRAGAPARAELRTLVDLYLRARFGAREIGEEGRRTMSRALERIERGLRGNGAG